MPVRIIESKQNPRLKELRKALAQPGRNERGLVAIEGPNLLAEAIRAGLRFKTVFFPESHAFDYPKASAGQFVDCEMLMVPSTILAGSLDTESPQPVAALVEPPEWTWAHIFGTAKVDPPLIVVLANLQDPGNLGAILRSAEAFGATGVVCLPGTVNAWNPKAVRASAGSIFRVPVLNAGVGHALTNLSQAGVRILATAVNNAQPADLIDLAGPVALVIGNEGNGVPKDIAAKSDGAVTIPCPGPVESLNAAVAASVLLYEAAQQRKAARQRAAKMGKPLEGRGGKR
jgi:RNA methyltransferase, TrmH family